MLTQQCLYRFVFQFENSFVLYSKYNPCEIILSSRLVSNPSTPISPTVHRVVPEGPTVARMPQNQHDKLLITSGHLSVRVGTVRWTIPRNAVTQPPPAVWVNGCRVSQSQCSQFGPSDSCAS